MPRKPISARKRRDAWEALRLQSAHRRAVVERRDHHAREAALALRKATPDWVDLDQQVKQHQLEAEMDGMEACLDARRPEIPILNFDLMPGFSPPTKLEPEMHPDVKIQAELSAMQEPRTDRDWRNWE